MQATKKYAMRFPELETRSKSEPLSVYSHTYIIRTEHTFLSTFDAVGSVCEFLAQRNRTGELRKQLRAKKEALDAEIDSKMEQVQIMYEEEVERLKAYEEQMKHEMEIEFQRLRMETAAKAKEFHYSFEESMARSSIFHGIVLKEKEFLEAIQPFIEAHADDFSNRREYILYCELQRQSLQLIYTYTSKMI